jgi:hypothetical protein
MAKKKVYCCFCGKELKDPIIDGNNPSPLDNDPNHVCCAECNNAKVLPARIAMIYGKEAK